MRFIGIDPSTKTGFVALDENGKTLIANELTGVGTEDPYRMITLIDEIMLHLEKDDFVTIESFAFNAEGQYVVQLGGIGWGIRMALMRRGIKYYEVGTGQLKKYASGNGRAKKDELIKPVFENWGFRHSSDNVIDAYVLAQIGRSMKNKLVQNKKQEEVILKIFETINGMGK